MSVRMQSNLIGGISKLCVEESERDKTNDVRVFIATWAAIMKRVASHKKVTS